MSADSEKLYTARETASALGLGAAMLRRYASTYETVSGDAITVHRRDGRLFTETQVQVLTAARSLVLTTNVDVKTAIKGVLDRPLEVVPLRTSSRHAPSLSTPLALFRRRFHVFEDVNNCSYQSLEKG